MANNSVKVNLQFNANTSQAQAAITNLNKSLESLYKAQQSANFSDLNLNKAVESAKELESHLSKAFNTSTNKLDLTAFSQSLAKSGTSLQTLNQNLLNAGASGQKVFLSLAQSIAQSEVPLKQVNQTLQNFGITLKNTVKWEISSSMIHGLESALSGAISYAKDLNSSLNDIRIVTGQSVDQMSKFASTANQMAQELSTTTTAYSKAALIFYQQGLDDKAVKERTDTVIKMANVTKDSAADVSSYMTAIWNNFDDGTKSLEHYADVITALGASTASSSAEIAAGLEKFASIGKTIGLSYDYATSALATIVANTRQSAETVGTGLRTIFSRLQGLKLGDTLEDGVDLNKYSKALQTVGVQVLDATGNMREMDAILEDLASKWGNLSKAEQTALAQTVGGVRQYTTLISLMDNWDDMSTNLNTASKSDGSLQKQADIYAESWEAASQRSKAAMEGLFQAILNDKGFITMTNAITGVTKAVTGLVGAFGGLPGLLGNIGSIAVKVFSSQIQGNIDKTIANLKTWTSQFSSQGLIGTLQTIGTGKAKTVTQLNFQQASRDIAQTYNSSGNANPLTATGKDYTASAAAETLAWKNQLIDAESRLSAAEKQTAQAAINDLSQQQQKIAELIAEKEQLIQTSKTAQQQDQRNVVNSTNRPQGTTTRDQRDWVNQQLNEQANIQRESGGFLTSPKITAADTSSIDNLLNKYQELSKQSSVIASLQQKVATCGDQIDSKLKAKLEALLGHEIDATVTDGLKEDLEKLQEEIAEAQDQLDDLVGATADGMGDRGGDFESAMQDAIEHARERGQRAGSLNVELEFESDSLDNLRNKIKDALNPESETYSKISKFMTGAASAAGSLAAGLSTGSNLAKAFAADADSLTNKLSASASAVTTLVSSFASGGWIGLAVAGASMLFSYIKQASEEAERIRAEAQAARVEAVNTQTEASAEELSNVRSLLDNYNELYAKYKAGQTTQEELTTSAVALAEAYGLTAATVLAMTGDFEGFNNAIAETLDLSGQMANADAILQGGRNAVSKAKAPKIKNSVTYDSYNYANAMSVFNGDEFAQASLNRQALWGNYNASGAVDWSFISNLIKADRNNYGMGGDSWYLSDASSSLLKELLGGKISASTISGMNLSEYGINTDDLYEEEKVGSVFGFGGHTELVFKPDLLMNTIIDKIAAGEEFDLSGFILDLFAAAGLDSDQTYETLGIEDYVKNLLYSVADNRDINFGQSIIDSSGLNGYTASSLADYLGLGKNNISADLFDTTNGTFKKLEGTPDEIVAIYNDYVAWQSELESILGTLDEGSPLYDYVNGILTEIKKITNSDSEITKAVETYQNAQDTAAQWKISADLISKSIGKNTNNTSFKEFTQIQSEVAAGVDAVYTSFDELKDFSPEQVAKHDEAYIKARNKKVQEIINSSTALDEYTSMYNVLSTEFEPDGHLDEVANLIDSRDLAFSEITYDFLEAVKHFYATAEDGAKLANDDIVQTVIENNKRYSDLDTKQEQYTTVTTAAKGFKKNMSQSEAEAFYDAFWGNEELISQMEEAGNPLKEWSKFISMDFDAQKAYVESISSDYLSAVTTSANAIITAHDSVIAEYSATDDALVSSLLQNREANAIFYNGFANLYTQDETTGEYLRKAADGTIQRFTDVNAAWSDYINQANVTRDDNNQYSGTYSQWSDFNYRNNLINAEDRRYDAAQTTVNAAQLTGSSSNTTVVTEFEKATSVATQSVNELKTALSALDSIDITNLPSRGTQAYEKLAKALKQAGIEITDFAAMSKSQQLDALEKAKKNLLNQEVEQQRAIQSAYATKYGFTGTEFNEEQYKAALEKGDGQAYLTYLQAVNAETEILAQRDELHTETLAKKVELYEQAYQVQVKAAEAAQKEAQQTQTLAKGLEDAVATGELNSTQTALLAKAGLSEEWANAATEAERGAVAAKAWTMYANQVEASGNVLTTTYADAIKIASRLQGTVKSGTSSTLDSQAEIIDLFKRWGATDEVAGALDTAFNNLNNKLGKDWFKTLSFKEIGEKLNEELTAMGENIQFETLEAADTSAAAIKGIFSSMAEQNIAAAQAAANAWKDAFTQIANFRKSLLEGDDILSKIAGNPEAFAQGLASYRKTHSGASAQEFYAAVANGNVKASDLQYTDFDINQYMADTGRSFATKKASVYRGTHFGTIADEITMPDFAKVGWLRNRDAQALVDNGQASDFNSAKIMLNDWYTAAFKKMVKEDGTAYTDNEIGALVTRIQQGDIEAYRLLSTGLDRIEDYAEITADASRLNTARQEATSALQGVQNDTTRTAEFRGQQRTESELNNLNAAINAAQKIKEQEGRWEDIDANSRRILEENGITSFDGLSGAATDCAGALAVLAGAAEAAAQAQLGKVGTYKNGDEYGQILDKDGNLVQLEAGPDGKYDAAGFLAEHENGGYTFNTDQATTTAMSTMATTTQAALDTETDTKQSEILSEAKLAGFSSKEEQEEYIRLAVERNEIASAEEMIEQGICKTKEEALELQREYANQLRKCERGLKSLADNGKKWVKTVKDATASISDQSIAMKGLRQGYKDILNLSDSAAEALNAEFLTNSEMLKLAETAASDSGTKGQQALNKLQAAAAAAITPFDDMEAGLDKIAQAIADVNLQAGDLFAGADYSMVDNYWNTVVDKCLASGDTIGQAVETANAALNGLGVDVNPQLEIVTETLDPAGFQAILEKTGTKTVTVPDGVGGTREVTYDEFKQIYEEAGSTPIPFTYVKGKGAPGANKYTKRAEKPGGGGGGRGGGGGGRGRDPRRANKINKKDNIERYHEIDNVIDDLADAYKRLNKEEERAWGKNRINAMQQESKIIKEQIAAVEEKIRQAKEWKKQDLSTALSAGWTFDANGNVNNYDEFLSSQIDKYNAAIDSYNNMSADAQEELDKKYKDMTNKDGEYYSSYEDYLKKTLIDDPKEALEQYEETMELLEDLGIEYDDFLNEWHDNIIGQIQTKLDTTLEITKDQLDYLEHKLGRIEDDAYSAAEAIGLMSQQMDIAQTQFNAQKSALDDLLKAYSPEGTVWSAEDLMNGNISIKDLVNAGMQSEDIKLIQTIMEGLTDASEQMSEQMSSSIEHMANAFEEFNSDMDRYISTVEHAQTITSTYRNIIDLTGRTMSKFNSTMLKSINDAIAAQSVANLEVNKTKYETVKTQYDEAKAAYEAAQASYAEGGIDAAALKAAKDTYQAAQDNMNEAQEAFLSSWEEALQTAADAFQSNMEAAVRDIGEMMSGGLAGGLAELEDAFAKMNEQDQNYVDDYEKIYQLTKMTRDLNDKIDSTSNVRAQKELLKYQKELNGLLESDQEMSSYDLDYLQKKLDLKLAEIALDEAQNAKSQVTMRRDSEGNYNYVYTADENAVEKAESEYANKLYEMQKANDEYITNLSENMANLSSQMLSEIAAIDTTIYDTEEKYQAEVQRITDHYTTQMEYYNSEMNKVLDNNKTLYEQDWTNFNKYTGYKISAEENYVTRWNQTVLSQVTGFETQEEFYENFNKAVFGEDPAHPSGESLIGRLVTAYKSMRDQITAANAAAGVETEDLATALLGNIEAATQEAEAAADGITDAATEIVSQITSIGDAVTDMVNNYSQAMATMEAETDAMLGVLLDFLTAYGEIGDLNVEPGVLAEIEARRRERQENPEGFDTGGYTGAWGSEGRLAYLHQKELVLNAEDTVNMLTSVGILRQIASIIDLNALASAGGFISLMSSGVGGNQGTLQQEVHIEANFPAVTDKNQIEEAFGDLVNLAAQYANRRV